MKTIGIDFGTKRIGLALTDAEGILAYPFKVISQNYPRRNVFRTS